MVALVMVYLGVGALVGVFAIAALAWPLLLVPGRW